LDEGRTVYQGPVAEGTKFLKRNGYYYLLIPEGGVETGNQVALRSRNIYGPYEKKVVLEQGTTSVRGPHQGGLIELENGESWFIHFVCQGAWGRVAYLEPVKWESDWPYMGVARDGCHEPVLSAPKPMSKAAMRPCLPQADDSFDSPELGLQWAWNHNPVDGRWSLTERKGWFRIKSSRADDFWHVPNTLTQKMMGADNHAVVKLDFRGLADGQVAGFGHMSDRFCWIGVEKVGGAFRIKVNSNGQVQGELAIGPTEAVWLKTSVSSQGEARFSFSTDGVTYQPLGGASELRFGFWKGSRLCLFSYHTGDAGGNADFDDFHYAVFSLEVVSPACQK
jgi:beta-xylosidase